MSQPIAPAATAATTAATPADGNDKSQPILPLTQELIAPIQAQVAAAIREVARRKKLDVVFDKGSNLAVVYANESLDITNEVLQQLGF